MPRHRTLPIPQVIPQAAGQSDDEPGVSGYPWHTHAAGQPLDTKRQRKSVLRTPVYHRDQIERGIDSALDYRGREVRLGTVPMQVRATLAQTIAAYRAQISHYISWIKPFGMAPGYPTAHVLTLIQTAPSNMSNRSRPRSGGYNTPGQANSGATAERGNSPYFMGAARRFRKALPSQMNRFEPPTY